MSWSQVQGPVYSIAFVGSFLAIAIWESLDPLRELSSSAERRWSKHGILFAIAVIVSVLVLRLSPMAVSLLSVDNRFGILNRPAIPMWLRCMAGVAVLDLVQYWVHRSFHGARW